MTFSSSHVRLPWGYPHPPQESVRTRGRTFADVRTKFSPIDRLPNVLTNGAPLLTVKLMDGTVYNASQAIEEFVSVLNIVNEISQSAKYDCPGECSPDKDCLW